MLQGVCWIGHVAKEVCWIIMPRCKECVGNAVLQGMCCKECVARNVLQGVCFKECVVYAMLHGVLHMPKCCICHVVRSILQGVCCMELEHVIYCLVTD